MSAKSQKSPARGNRLVEKAVEQALRRAVRVQSGRARDYVATLRTKYPDESPAQLRARLDARFMSLITASGTAVGAAGAVPGIGTVTALGAASVESVFFIEASAFYTLAVAAVHGLDVTSVEHEETLVMTILLGASGTSLLSGALGRKGAAGGSLAGGALHLPSVSELNHTMVNRFVRKYAIRRTTLVLGKLAPAGIGAAIGGWGNRKLGQTVVSNAHETFGTPPPTWNAA